MDTIDTDINEISPTDQQKIIEMMNEGAQDELTTAQFDLTKTVYAYDKFTGEYVSETLAHLCPVTLSTYLYPAHTTEMPPPVPGERQVAIWNGDDWELVADWRAVKLWSTETAQSVQAKIGETPETLSATTLEPPQFGKWTGKKWGIDAAAKSAETLAQAETELAARRQAVDQAIMPLQDAVDLDLATNDEIEQLKSLKKCRVLLNRVPQQSEWPEKIEWPRMQ